MQIRFESKTKYGLYKDALNLDDNHTFTDDQIEEMKQQRISRWVYNIENPPAPVVDPVPEVDPATVTDPGV